MTERKQHDLAVISSGPGAYGATIKAAQIRLSAALIEKLSRTTFSTLDPS